ncbi:nucleoside diphosphate-linked moiety X motif 17 isoform X1 [Anser cygnoides]|uniref:nucleoside diphosphate-linked moiety X motif 17 isoform X1 n=1 Tax=Anser cygnoides TaxID=8845 RepID=UPI0034D308E7
MAGLGRVLVHVRRGGEGGAARFGQSVTGAFCAPHEDAAAVSCGLQRGCFVLADAAFPGSTETVLRRPPFCPAKLLGAQPAAELRGRGVEAAVAVLLQAGTGRVLLTRRAAGLRGFPNVWVPPAAGRGAARAAGGDGAAPGGRHLHLEAARPLGVRVPPHAEPGAPAAPPRRRLPAAVLRGAPRGAGGQAQPQRERGERLRLAGAARPGGHRSHRGRRGELGKRPRHAAGLRQHHGGERGLAPRHAAPHGHAAEHGASRGGGRGARQHRHQVRPWALVGGPGGGAGASRALRQRHGAGSKGIAPRGCALLRRGRGWWAPILVWGGRGEDRGVIWGGGRAEGTRLGAQRGTCPHDAAPRDVG